MTRQPLTADQPIRHHAGRALIVLSVRTIAGQPNYRVEVTGSAGLIPDWDRSFTDEQTARDFARLAVYTFTPKTIALAA